MTWQCHKGPTTAQPTPLTHQGTQLFKYVCMYATKGYSFHLSSEYSILTSLVNKLSLDNNKHIPYTSHVCMYMACTVKPFQLFVFCSHQQMEAEHGNRGGIHKSHKVSSLSGGPPPPTESALPLTAPTSMSYPSVPKLHQSTALPWPVLCSISGALGGEG